jgi:heme exporter protein D
MNEFLSMGGYAVFIWTSFGISLVVLLLNVVMPIMRRKQLIREVSSQIKRKK